VEEWPEMLEVRGLNQYYGGSHTLRGIDLSVPAGTCTALLGRNGVGKTTLLRCLMGLLPVRSGRIAFEGADISRLTAYQRARLGIGYVPQGREIFPRLTVAENLAVGEAAAGPARPMASRDEVEGLFPALRAMQKRRGGDLSGGQQQQLAIARALVARPKLLLLDEPTEGIQPSIVKDIERVLRILLERGMTILLVEQYVDFAKSLAQHYAILSRGQVVDRGAAASLDTAEVRRHLAV
jgi:urea transport system ATP-binding protein